MSVSVVGLGRVGLMTLFHLAKYGFSPYGVDINEELLNQLARKQLPFLEPEFHALLIKHHKKIKFSNVFPDTKYNFISVPTAFDSLTQEMDLDPICSVLKQIVTSSFDKKYVFVRSTLMPGSCKKLSNQFKNLSISYFPEFFREGHFVEDYRNASFSVLGCGDKEASRHFAPFQFASTELCSPEEAEILKAMSNMFHALKVSFANEVGRMARAFHSSPHRIMDLFMKDSRLNISKAYLKPGFSFGGPCLKKDIQSLHSVQNPKLVEWSLSKFVEEGNRAHTEWTAERVLSLKPKTISILGCSFTGSQTIDYRDSQVLKLVEILSHKQDLQIYGIEKILERYSCVIFSEESPEKLMDSDVFVLGGWTPLLKKYSALLSNYQGLVFDLLVQDMPQFVKAHPRYKNLYSL